MPHLLGRQQAWNSGEGQVHSQRSIQQDGGRPEAAVRDVLRLGAVQV